MTVARLDPERCREFARRCRAGRAAGDYLLIARKLEAAADLSDEVEAVKHILGAGFSGETLRQAAERVELACAERARERDAAREERDELRKRAKRIDEGERRVLADYDEVVAERDAARAECDQLRKRVFRLEALSEHYELCARAYRRIHELNEICQDHPGIDDPVGIQAENELMELCTKLQEYAAHIREAIAWGKETA